MATPGAALTPTVATAATQTPAGTDRSGKAPRTRIVVGVGVEPTTLMPRIGATAAQLEILAALFTPLVGIDDGGELVALGAESVPTPENGGAIWIGRGDDRRFEATFKLRSGWRWHDGAPVTARDVRFFWRLVSSPTFPADARDDQQRIDDVRVLDDRTVVLIYRKAFDPLYPLAAGALPEHLLGSVPPARLADHPYARQPVGNGPFRFAGGTARQSIALEAEPDHALGAPKAGSLLFTFTPETEAALAALTRGEVDVLTRSVGLGAEHAPEIDRLAAPGAFAAHFAPGAAWEHVDFNLDNEHLRERSVRQAIAYGVDRAQIVERLLGGKTSVVDAWVPPDAPAWSRDSSCAQRYNHDPDRARALLAEAGYVLGPDGVLARAGRKLQLRLTTSDDRLRTAASQMIQAQLRLIGIVLDLELMSGSKLVDPKGPLQRRAFELALYSWRAPPDPARSDYLVSRSVPNERNGYRGNNLPGYTSARADDLAIRGAALAGERDRRPIYCELVRLWTDDLPALPLFFRPTVAVSRAGLRGLRLPPGATPTTWNVAAWSRGES